MIASLNVPLLPAKTDVVARTLLLTFADIPFTAISHDDFSDFLNETTQGVQVSFDLTGKATSALFPCLVDLAIFMLMFSFASQPLPRPLSEL